VVFSSNRRVSNNTTKDTLHNIERQKECVISAVSYDIMRQMALTSVELPAGESEYDLTGLTPVPSEMVAVPGVAESPVNMECKVKEIIKLGDHGGAGHLIICEVQVMHIEESVIVDDRIDPHKIDLVGRMGRSYYVRASGDAVLSMYQSVVSQPIGYQQLPDLAKHSDILSGNDIGAMAALTELPSDEEIALYLPQTDDAESRAKVMIANGDVSQALALLMAAS